MRVPREFRVKHSITWGDVEVGDRLGTWKVVGIRHLGDRLFFHLVDLDDGMVGSLERYPDDPVDDDYVHGNPKNPKGGVTYLAIMPRHRKPKTVPKSHISFYQKSAREFYEAPGMTAAEARQAIKDGTLKPTWINGQPVVAYSLETGEPRTEARIFMADLMKQVEESRDRDVVLRIGRNIYQPQYSFRSSFGGRGSMGMTWHDTDISGFTYDPTPLSQHQLELHLALKDTWEMVWLQEDYNGIPMGGIVVLAQSGRGLEGMNSDSIRAKLSGLAGRKWRSRQRVEGGMLRPADLEWSY